MNCIEICEIKTNITKLMQEKSFYQYCASIFICYRGSALDPDGEAHEAPPFFLVDWGSRHSPHLPTWRLRRLDFPEVPSTI